MTARRPGRPPGETTMSAGVSASGRASGSGQRGSVPVAVPVRSATAPRLPPVCDQLVTVAVAERAPVAAGLN